MSESAPQVVGPVLPADAAHGCERCLACCRQPWLIEVTEDEAERLRRLYPDLSTTHVVTGDDGARRHAISRRADGACVLLEAEGCRLHREHGYEVKPAICRRFPAFFWRQDDTVLAHLSRLCPAVYAGRGARGETLAESLRPLIAMTRPLPSRHAEVRFAGAAMLSGETYAAWEERLIALLRDDRWPLDDAMVAGVKLIERQLTQRLEADDLALEIVMDAIAGREYVPGTPRLVLAAIVTAIERPRRGPGKAGFVARLLLRRGRIRLDTLGVEVPLRPLDSIRWPRRHTPDLSPVRSLLASHVRRGILREAPDIEFGYYLLLAAYATLRFYARAEAAAADREHLIPGDIEKAVRVVEYHLLLHRRLRALQERGLFTGLCRKLLFHSSFPGSLAAG